jgi:uncharacterized protein (DUF2249 family)
MNLRQNSHSLIAGMLSLVRKVVAEEQPSHLHQNIDALYSEIYHWQETLAKTPTRPSRVVRLNRQRLEPISEQQRIMDMSG